MRATIVLVLCVSACSNEQDSARHYGWRPPRGDSVGGDSHQTGDTNIVGDSAHSGDDFFPSDEVSPGDDVNPTDGQYPGDGYTPGDDPNPGDGLSTCTMDPTIHCVRRYAGTGETVYVQNVIVTGLTSAGFFAQDEAPNAEGYSGIFVFTVTSPVGTVAVGNLLSLSGVKADYYGEPEFTDPTGLVVTGSSVALPIPIDDLASIATNGASLESLKCMLVAAYSLSGVSVTANVDAAHATYEYDIDGTLFMSGRAYEGTSWDSKAGGWAGIAGVLGYRWYNSQLCPRSDADFMN